MAMTGGTDVQLKSAVFPNSSNKHYIHLYAHYKITSSTATSKVISVGMYIYSTGSGWPFGPWSTLDSGSYISCTNVISGDSTHYTTTTVPSTNSTPYWIFENKTFTVSAQASSVTIGWKLACNPSNWIGDSSWNRPSGTFSISLTPYYSACGTPSNLSVSDGGNNIVTLSCKVGSNGNNNNASSVDLFVTYNGTAPSASNYTRTFNISGTAGSTVTRTLDFNTNTLSELSGWLGTDYKGPIKFVARTRGGAGSSYYSSVSSAASGDLTWYSSPTAPSITKPSTNESMMVRNTYTVTWSASTAGKNNAVASYSIRVYNVTTAQTTENITTTATNYTFPAGTFIGGNVYKFYIKAVGTKSTYSSAESESGSLTAIAAEGLPNFTLNISDENAAVPMTRIYGVDSFVVIDGANNVAKFTWTDPELPEGSDDLSGYHMTVTSTKVGELIQQDLGKINHFYLKGDYFTGYIAPWEREKTMEITVTITAKSRYGADFDSFATKRFFISFGSGVQIPVTTRLNQKIYKRSIAFINLTPEAQQSNWELASNVYFSNTEQWKDSDISHEILLDNTGDILYDSNNSPIYTL